jgi:hypothetical protein
MVIVLVMEFPPFNFGIACLSWRIDGTEALSTRSISLFYLIFFA